ncbi:methylmalonyl-CoA mutase, N-terminal domain [Variovorax sp. HW608]|uniref:methylmalonyl-CoA mutase family protein n=1 Tax=Variovorax sp. HW608 TaxID=1034889 RepID=UPI00081FC441|nr:methylmalonyl-CoA mutase family protein [Variovorax sp. HW608]SCK10811.1 methylmalonyl-CoA mutase, N-terminal domain [Variovorax sp. HW608]
MNDRNPKDAGAREADVEARLEDVSVRLSRTRTWSGIETQAVYGPEDLPDFNYGQELGDPGIYPYARGAYPQMYRSRMWTLRNIVGYGAPEDTREGIERALEMGTAGINVVLDTLTQEAIDPDHPVLSPDAGQEGCSVPTVNDLGILLEGLDITKTDVAWHSTMMIYPLVVALATRQGRDISKLQGSHMPDHLQLRLAGWSEAIVPAALGHRTTVDCLEYSARHSPRWALGCPQAYDIRERGATAAGEIAIGMAIVNQTLHDLATRGVHVDQVAPSMAWVSTADIDLFEEVAKFRALRRVWARTMKERFGSADPRAQRLRVACHTSGRSLVYQQPLNNLTRAAVQTLAALLGGVQSVETCTYDEPLCIPTEEARELATRTQQILAHEIGAARTADPLGGSWYVESLTRRVEVDALALLERIEGIGLIKAIEDGMIEGLLDEYNYRHHQELDREERIVVGVNRFKPKNATMPRRFSFDPARMNAHLRRFVERKAARDRELLGEKIGDLYRVAQRRENSHQAMVDALVADATVAEVWGTVRVANGLPYDPFRAVESPFTYPSP